MTNPNAVAGYKRAMAIRGRWVILRRVTGQAPNAATFDATVNAIVTDYKTEAPVMAVKREGAITQGGRNIIILTDDLTAARFPLPVKKNDKLILLEDQAQGAGQVAIVLADGRTVYEGDQLNVTDPDPSKRRVAGAEDFMAVGA